ncbi:putative signaling protein [bioreactor metagenome]
MRDPERSSETLSRCKALGLKIAVDDFGTGYSSLAYLRRFPIDRLKIDRSFIKDVVDEPDDAAIAQTIIAMAHSLRLTVVAEGVEDEAQLRLLQRWDCDIYQGFLSSRPQPADAITSLLLGMKAARVSSLSPPASVF